MEGDYTEAFELVWPRCGGDPCLDYSEIPSRLQWLRGSRMLEATLAAHGKHLGLAPSPNRAIP